MNNIGHLALIIYPQVYYLVINLINKYRNENYLGIYSARTLNIGECMKNQKTKLVIIVLNLLISVTAVGQVNMGVAKGPPPIKPKANEADYQTANFIKSEKKTESPAKEVFKLSIDRSKMGGVNGGGGGGIKLPDGTILTMAQAGLEFPDQNQDQDPFYVDAASMRTAIGILKQLENYCPVKFKGSSCKFVLDSLVKELSSNDHLYEKPKVVDQKLFNRLKGEYAKYVQLLKLKGDFVLPAYTENKKTFLFPDFFAASVETRGIYLIHEALFSLYGQKIALHTVLKSEVAIVDVLANQNPTTLRAFHDAMAMAQASDKLWGSPELADAQIVGNYLEYLQKLDISVPFTALFNPDVRLLSDVIIADCNNRSHIYKNLPSDFKYEQFSSSSTIRLAGGIEVNPYAISESREIEASLFKVFYGKKLNFVCANVVGNETALNYPITDLEFRGTQIFHRNGKPVTGYLTNFYDGYLEDGFAFHKRKILK